MFGISNGLRAPPLELREGANPGNRADISARSWVGDPMSWVKLLFELDRAFGNWGCVISIAEGAVRVCPSGSGKFDRIVDWSSDELPLSAAPALLGN